MVANHYDVCDQMLPDSAGEHHEGIRWRILARRHRPSHFHRDHPIIILPHMCSPNFADFGHFRG
jgi:hypothetical protein